MMKNTDSLTDTHLFYRPQVDVKQMNRILQLVKAGKNDGQVVHGGRRHGTKVGGYIFDAGVLEVPRLTQTRVLLSNQQSF